MVRNIMHWALLALMTAFSVSLVMADESGINLKNGLAIHGYDPVSYHQGEPLKGIKELSLRHNGATYHFATRENMKAFEQAPESFEPAYGGWCAWAMLDGEKVDVNPKTYKIVDGTNYLFYNAFFTNTLSKWNDLAAEKGEVAMIEQADSAWESLGESR